MTGGRGTSVVAGRLAFARGLARLPFAVLPLVIVGQHGASASTDCFFLVYSGVMFATNSFAPLLESVVVPFVAEARRDTADARFVKAVLIRAALLCAPVSVLLALLALSWHAVGWPMREGWEAGWQHLLMLAWIPILNALASILAGYLNAGEWFLSAASAGSVRGAVSLGVGLLFSSSLGVRAYALGLTLGEVAALAWLAATRPGTTALRATAAERAALAPFWRLFFSMAAGGLANSSRGFVDRLVATSLGAGAVSIMESAERIFLMGTSFLGAPFATVVLSRWAHAFAAGGSADRLLLGVRRAQRLALALGCALLLVYPLVTLGPVWSALFGRVDASEIPIARLALLYYLVGSVPYLLGLVTTQAILVLRDSAFVAAVAAVVALLNVPLDLIGARVLGLPGIALGSSMLHLVGWLAAERRLRNHARRAIAARAG